MSTPKVAQVSLREFARITGRGKSAVSEAARGGRLPNSTVWSEDGKSVLGFTSVLEAEAEWARNTDVSKAPPAEQDKAFQRKAMLAGLSVRPPDSGAEGDQEIPDKLPDGTTVENAGAAGKFWDAKLKELKFREAAGELVNAERVKRKLGGLFAACKTKLLAVPSRLRQQLPHLTPEDEIAIEALIREVCADLVFTQPPPETE